MERHGWLDTKGGDNRITKYDMADALLEHFPPDVGESFYSDSQIRKMLDYNNSANPAGERACRHFASELNTGGSVDQFDLRMYLYGA